MKRIPDPTGRFTERPFYNNDELDASAERLIIEFIHGQHGEMVYPIPTDDLTKLIERDTADLDFYADLADEGAGVQGVTYFPEGTKPKVRIAASLSADHSGHRLRTTLTHEYGHVYLHAALYAAKYKQGAFDLFPTCCEAQKCRRDSMIPAFESGDWMEWQAGYMSGALLMPGIHVRALIDQIARSSDDYNMPVIGSRHANILVNSVADAYDVSKEAARIRLIQLGRIVRSHHQNEAISY